MSFNEWKRVQFGELVSINAQSISGKFPFKEIEYIDTSSVTMNTFEPLQKLNLRNAPTRAKRIVHHGDTILSTVRPIQRHIGFIRNPKPNTIASTGFAVITPKNINPEFLYYYLSQESITNYLNGIAETSTTTFPAFRPEVLSVLEIVIPDDEKTQSRIAEILSALDDKIEQNRQTNATIEAIAQAIFKEWFIDFNSPDATGEMVKVGGVQPYARTGMIPKGWQVGKLGDILNSIETGTRPKGGVGFLSEGIPSIGAENIISLGVYDYSKEKFISIDFFAKIKKGIVKSGDVLLYKDGASLGRKSIFMDEFPHKICAVNEHVFILRTNNQLNQIYLYFWLDQSFMTENIKNLNANSAQPGISQPGVSSLPILIPSKKTIDEYEQIVGPLLRKLFCNCKESTFLSQIRDSLLPKLMNGEIEV
jgi:type I restriction enzyme S subunit